MFLRLRFMLQQMMQSGKTVLAAICVLVFQTMTVAAAGFSGQFDGIGTAVGMMLTLEEAEGRVVGRFASGRGDPFTLNGRRTGDAAQGSVSRSDQNFFFHLEARPLGVQFLLIPRAPDGSPDMSGATDYSFVQQGLQVPQPSAYQASPPRGIDVDIFDFIDSFRLWDPIDMARIYASLDDRYKGLVQLFDHAAAEVVWRVCATRPPNVSFSQDELDRLLERQHASCEDYMISVASVRDAGLLNEFLRKANFQFELIRETVKCDRGLSPETKCADVSAMSGPLMVRWRRAHDIMSQLVGGLPMMRPIERSEAIVTREPQAHEAEVLGGIAVTVEQDATEVLPRARPGRPIMASDAATTALPDVQQNNVQVNDGVELRHTLPRPRPGVRLRR
jgi:hypothetical protein